MIIIIIISSNKNNDTETIIIINHFFLSLSIDEKPFYNCIKIVIPYSVTKIMNRAIEGTVLTYIDIPSSVLEIGEFAFKD